MNKPLPHIIALLSLLLLATYSHAQITATAQASKDTICRGEQVSITATVNTSNLFACGISPFVCGGNPLVVDSIAPERLLQQGQSSTVKTVYGKYYMGYRMQFLYKAEELANILNQGIIQSLGWQIGTFNNTGLIKNFNIKVGCVPSSQDALTTWETGLSTVYNSAAYTPIYGWNVHDLQQPYYWDGSSNLVIEVSHYDSSSYGAIANRMRYSNLPGTVLFASSDSNITQNNSITPTIWHERPNLLLKGCYPAPAPSTQFFWFKNDSLMGANTQITYDLPEQTSLYSMMTVYNNDTTWSNPVTVYVKQTIPASFSPSTDTVVCSNTVNIMLAANNVYTSYHWSNGANTPSINVTDIDDYSLTATDTLGCTTTAGPINVSKYTSPAYTIQSGNYCQALPQVIFPSGDIMYTWSNGDTGTVFKVRNDGTYTVTASYANCLDTFSVGFLATSDTMEHTYFDLEINTDMGYYDFVVHPTNYPNYIIHTTQDTTFGPFNSQPITVGFYSLPCNIYYNRYIRIVTTNNVCIDTTGWQFMPVCFPTAIAETAADGSIKLYPNPANNFIELDLGNAQIDEVMIIDALGRTYTTSSTKRIDISMLAAGVHSLIAKTQYGHSRASFVKY